MIQKWYEVSCDYCGCAVNHYTYRPTATDLRKDGIKVVWRNGKLLAFCDKCITKITQKKQ